MLPLTGSARALLAASSVLLALALAALPAAGADADGPSPSPAGAALQVSKAAAVAYTPPRFAESDPVRSDIRVSYTDVPTQARPAVEFAVGQLARALASAVPVRVDVLWRDVPGAGRGGSPFRLVDGRFVPYALLDAQAGSDQDPSQPDVTLLLDSSGTPWHFPTDGDVPADRVDLATVAMHELLHGLGFVGFATVDASGSGSYNPEPAVFDDGLRDASGASLARQSGRALGDALTSGALYFDGAATRAATGDRARLNAPATFTPGVSVYHLDEGAYGPGVDGSLMTPSVSTGEAVHDPGAVVLGILDDIGWDVADGGGDPVDPPLVPRTPTLACPANETPAERFDDVDGGPHAINIGCVVWWSVAQGRSASAYAPDTGVTREQMASFLLRVLQASDRAGDLPPSPRQAFRDVPPGGPHSRSVDTLAAVGVVGGRADGTYDPAGLVTRAQMATFLVRAAQFATSEELPDGGDPFRDDDGDTHEQSIGRVAAAGITGGTAPGQYSPAVPVRRDQMASFLARTLDLLVEEGVATPPA